MPEASTSNIREYTVSELSGALRRAIEDGFALVRVRGELGRVTKHGNGHIYLDLKDADACIAGVIWGSTARRLKIAPAQGMEVIATGRLSTFAPQSKYQLVIDAIGPAGTGALMALLEERKKKLAAEGLFDPARKREIPYLPDVVGVVTSPSGAVIRDILHRFRDRFPRHVLVWPTPVQGRGAEFSIAAAIDGFNRLAEGGDIPPPDVLIVARGGGSLEDIWCFNEEAVARAVAASRIPLISAVGHETDTTLIDLVADLRAPTPSAAAEMAVPKRSDLLAEILNKQRRMIAAAARRSEERRIKLQAAVRGLGRPEDAVGRISQRLDRASDRLVAALRRRSNESGVRFARLAGRLGGPERLERAAGDARRALGRDSDRLRAASLQLLNRPSERLNAASLLLRSLSYQGVLERGYALVRRPDGAIARRASTLPSSGSITLVFADGERKASVGGTSRSRRTSEKPQQESLFDFLRQR